MATNNDELKSIKVSLSDGKKEQNSFVKDKECSTISNDVFNSGCANKGKHSMSGNNSQIFSAEYKDANILNDTAEEKPSKLVLEDICGCGEKSDFQNRESKVQSISDGHFVTNDDKSQLSDGQIYTDSPKKDNEDSASCNSEGDFVCNVIDEYIETDKNTGSSISNNEDSDFSVYEEDSQHTIYEESDTVVLSEDDVSDSSSTIEKNIEIKGTAEEDNSINISELEDENNSDKNSKGNSNRADENDEIGDENNKIGDENNKIGDGNDEIGDENDKRGDGNNKNGGKNNKNGGENSNTSAYCEIQSSENEEDNPFDISYQLSRNNRDLQDNSDVNSDALHESGPVSKRQKILCDHEFSPSINNTYTEICFIKELSTAFQEKKTNVSEHGVQIIHEPFTCCVLPNFIQSDDYIDCLKQELMNVEMTEKLNDLYQFKSKDLEDVKTQNISSFKHLMKEECLNWMAKITDIPLNSKVDIFCASYTKTDHLLCHDDELEGRRIAFIFYLVPPDWDENDGGILDLFASVDGQPSEIHTSFSPKFNNFVFFEVGPVSFHQVSEVLTSKNRLSISGWFYGPSLTPSIPKKEKLLFKDTAEDHIDITEWINPLYFDKNTQLYIREIFEETYEISLPDFLKETKYKEVCEALMDSSINWTKKGPYNMRNFHETPDSDKIPQILQDCKTLFTSKDFFIILSNITALNLFTVDDETCEFGKVYSCIRKWNHGTYTLLHDQSFAEDYSLNVILYFNCSNWTYECGGTTHYVAVDEKEELLQIDPKPNLLGIAYITEGSSNFVKYVNSRANKLSPPFFHDIYSMYTEKE